MSPRNPGPITITGADSNECRVTAQIVGHAPTEEEAQELAEQVEIRLDSGRRHAEDSGREAAPFEQPLHRRQL